MIAASVLAQISITDPSEVVEKLLRIEGERGGYVTAGPTETCLIEQRLHRRPRPGRALGASILAIRIESQ